MVARVRKRSPNSLGLFYLTLLLLLCPLAFALVAKPYQQPQDDEGGFIGVVCLPISLSLCMAADGALKGFWVFALSRWCDA
jgi:phosphatidylglycerophosphate synthase